MAADLVRPRSSSSPGRHPSQSSWSHSSRETGVSLSESSSSLKDQHKNAPLTHSPTHSLLWATFGSGSPSDIQTSADLRSAGSCFLFFFISSCLLNILHCSLMADIFSSLCGERCYHTPLQDSSSILREEWLSHSATSDSLLRTEKLLFRGQKVAAVRRPVEVWRIQDVEKTLVCRPPSG